MVLKKKVLLLTEYVAMRCVIIIFAKRNDALLPLFSYVRQTSLMDSYWFSVDAFHISYGIFL